MLEITSPAASNAGSQLSNPVNKDMNINYKGELPTTSWHKKMELWLRPGRLVFSISTSKWPSVISKQILLVSTFRNVENSMENVHIDVRGYGLNGRTGAYLLF